jgi:hypothetical protein
VDGDALDSELVEALTLMAEANWVDSQALLIARYHRVSELGNERLNLFLLSITAASRGQPDSANGLWSRAQAAPLESATRYLDLQFTQNDPRQNVLIDLERAWWDFNEWTQSGPSVLSLDSPTEIDWELVIDGVLAADCKGLERQFGRHFDIQTNETSILWNLLALSYLEAGNVRTYEEMVSGAPPLPEPDSVPLQLQLMMRSQGLRGALALLEQGQWLTNLNIENLDSPASSTLESFSEDDWVAHMENGFAMLDLGQTTEAGRCFQSTVTHTDDRTLQVLSLNALSLSFFKLGDYTQAETVYHEFKTMLEQFPVDPGLDVCRRYRGWLKSVDSEPPDDLPFFSPFGTKSDWSGAEDGETVSDFWGGLSAALNHLANQEFLPAKRELQNLELSTSPTDTSRRYLISLGFLTIAVISGDHFEVQEFEMELNRLQEQTKFESDDLQNAVDAFRWAGLETLSARLRGEDGRPLPINPWQDIALVEV